MNFQSIAPNKSISLFVKNIWVFESEDRNLKTSLPFFADGYPGLMFQRTENGLIVHPHDKAMPEIFLYGQTIKPIELEISGAYLLIIFQLYPFVLRTFFNLVPQSINDNCYYLDDMKADDGITVLAKELQASDSLEGKVEVITNLLLSFLERKKQDLDDKIREAVIQIIRTKGQENILVIAAKCNLNMRTFERRFRNETGLSPKQFSQIIQFQASMEQLTVKDYSKLTDIVYQNGFADQSHFIRVFKAFTGKTPKAFKK
ncbi:helix-turn-helix domain-containing protein [Sphingobacterium gobiense]|uniref:AraC family transcriptional regulator n=1 Tax=Sphingobacterium gobiense TaxID=1382456 RepID=A0A2S9JV43_9SPHI|nr:helix-turn-helix domain-containing protein [Sphingobacterium gobiense]PRD57128.1 AraC family transcriptional regulator [Sphingobacterium gobiense]